MVLFMGPASLLGSASVYALAEAGMSIIGACKNQWVVSVAYCRSTVKRSGQRWAGPKGAVNMTAISEEGR